MSHHRHHSTPLAILGAATLALGAVACDDAPSTQIAGVTSDDAAAHLPGNGNGKAVYMADLEALNAGTLGIDAVEGKAIISEHRGQIRVKINARGLSGGTLHLQHIHAGDACPTSVDDANGDGFVDVLEGVPVYGAILIPLDSDISNTTNELGGFPQPDNQGGAITFTAEASLSSIEAAIGGPLDLSSRHIVLHSVDPDVPLPSTVQTIADLPSTLTLPVACGEINQVNGPTG